MYALILDQSCTTLLQAILKCRQCVPPASKQGAILQDYNLQLQRRVESSVWLTVSCAPQN